MSDKTMLEKENKQLKETLRAACVFIGDVEGCVDDENASCPTGGVCADCWENYFMGKAKTPTEKEHPSIHPITEPICAEDR